MPKKPALEITLEELSEAKSPLPKKILKNPRTEKEPSTVRTFRLPNKQYTFLMKQAGKQMSKGKKSNTTKILIDIINQAMK